MVGRKERHEGIYNHKPTYDRESKGKDKAVIEGLLHNDHYKGNKVVEKQKVVNTRETQNIAYPYSKLMSSFSSVTCMSINLVTTC